MKTTKIFLISTLLFQAFFAFGGSKEQDDYYWESKENGAWAPIIVALSDQIEGHYQNYLNLKGSYPNLYQQKPYGFDLINSTGVEKVYFYDSTGFQYVKGYESRYRHIDKDTGTGQWLFQGKDRIYKSYPSGTQGFVQSSYEKTRWNPRGFPPIEYTRVMPDGSVRAYIIEFHDGFISSPDGDILLRRVLKQVVLSFQSNLELPPQQQEEPQFSREPKAQSEQKRIPILESQDEKSVPGSLSEAGGEEGSSSKASASEKKRIQQPYILETLENATKRQNARFDRIAEARCLYSIAYGMEEGFAPFMSFGLERTTRRLAVITGISTDSVPEVYLDGTRYIKEIYSDILTKSEIERLENQIYEDYKKIRYQSSSRSSSVSSEDVEESLSDYLSIKNSIENAMNYLVDGELSLQGRLEMAWQIALLYELASKRIDEFAIREVLFEVSGNSFKSLNTLKLDKMGSREDCYKLHKADRPHVDYKILRNSLNNKFPEIFTLKKRKALEAKMRELLK